MQKLFDAGAVSLAELEQAETAVKTAEAQLAAVNSQIRENQVQLQYYRVTAPTDGARCSASRASRSSTVEAR